MLLMVVRHRQVVLRGSGLRNECCLLDRDQLRVGGGCASCRAVQGSAMGGVLRDGISAAGVSQMLLSAVSRCNGRNQILQGRTGYAGWVCSGCLGKGARVVFLAD